MRQMLYGSTALLVAALPWGVEAVSLVQILNLFNMFIGLFLTASILIFFGGLIGYFTRLGSWPSNRDETLKIMQWAVAMLFVLVVLVAIVQAFEEHTLGAMIVLAAIIIVVVVIKVIQVFMADAGGEEHH